MKTKFTSIMLLLLISINCHSQALEIIDAIGGTLLPKVVDGIKDIRDSGTKNKVKYDKDKFNEKMNDLNQYVSSVASSIADDAESLDAIGKMTARASQLYDDLGAMESFANTNLIQAVLASNNEPVQRQFAFTFDGDVAQLKQDIDGVKSSILSLTIDQSLKDNLTQLIDDIKTEYTDFETQLAQSGITRPTATTSINGITNYLGAINNSTNNISQIKQAIQSMLSTLNSRLSSYVNDASEVKDKVKNKFDELSATE
jgi:hypothetical protein